MAPLPPLVDPSAPLEASALARYSRQVILPGFGPDAQRRLAAARVLVVGAGGLGSAVVPALAAAGIGTIGIIDADVVEVSNLPRQTLHDPADVGRSKVASAVETVVRLNPATAVRPLPEQLSAANALTIFADYDLAVDGSDNFPTRYLVDDAATIVGIPSVWGAVHQFGGQAGVGWAAHGPNYRDLFPVPPAPGTVPSCAQAGVLPTVCAIIGGILASETIKLVTGVGEPLLGRVTSYDARSGGFRELAYQRDPDAVPVTELVDYEAFCGIGAAGVDEGEADAGEAEAVGPAVSADRLARQLSDGAAVQLVDVREEWEADLARIEGSILVPLGSLAARLAELDPAEPTVVYCHHAPRSIRAREILRAAGFLDVRYLDGGIDGWASSIDRSLVRY